MININIYKDINGDSGVKGYEYGSDYINVQFSTGATYSYSYQSAGNGNIEQMKKLADLGDGLNSFINLNVKYKYVR
ncbi:MAG: hypothetical protein WBA54_07085 [Acidaminobacteraceae bacterium]